MSLNRVLTKHTKREPHRRQPALSLLDVDIAGGCFPFLPQGTLREEQRAKHWMEKVDARNVCKVNGVSQWLSVPTVLVTY